jgi:hypothetical protein
MMQANQLPDFIQSALEASVFAAPENPGLTYQELTEAAKRAGYLEGEVDDAIRRAEHTHIGEYQNLLPGRQIITLWKMFMPRQEPDFRNLAAFDFVFSEFNQGLRQMGARSRLERAATVERGVSQGLPRQDLEAAITVLLLTQHLVAEPSGMLKTTSSAQYNPLPSEQIKGPSFGAMRRPQREEAMAIVREIVERRSDGRPPVAEPLDAFAHALTKLGYGGFRTWWVQIVGELRRAEPAQSSVSISVLSASLIEGALAFVVKHARSIGSATLASKDFDAPPKQWKIDDLVKSAAAGSGDAILRPDLKARADGVVRTRQRIHAGRMLEEFPQGVADLRPEEARGARQTAEDVVRAVLDWLDRFPPP